MNSYRLANARFLGKGAIILISQDNDNCWILPVEITVSPFSVLFSVLHHKYGYSCAANGS